VFLLLLICFEGFSGTASWVFFWSSFPHFLMGFALLSLLLPDFFPSPVLFCSVSLTVLFLGFTLGSFVWRVWYYMHTWYVCCCCGNKLCSGSWRWICFGMWSVGGESYFGVLDLTYLSWTGNATSAMDGREYGAQCVLAKAVYSIMSRTLASLSTNFLLTALDVYLLWAGNCRLAK
jgi:hypothetical protein